ncbi:unnamed protein product [Lota lota]
MTTGTSKSRDISFQLVAGTVTYNIGRRRGSEEEGDVGNSQLRLSENKTTPVYVCNHMDRLSCIFVLRSFEPEQNSKRPAQKDLCRASWVRQSPQPQPPSP